MNKCHNLGSGKPVDNIAYGNLKPLFYNGNVLPICGYLGIPRTKAPSTLAR